MIGTAMLNQPGMDIARAPNITLELIFRWPHAASMTANEASGNSN